MTACAELLSPVRTGRCSVETMPSVTVFESPSGAPTASTAWPTFRTSELAKVAAFRPLTPLILSTARSADGSVPTMVAATVWPSLSVTFTDPPPAAALTTWLLVRM